jgi:type VI secretion system protein ImpL
MSLVRRVIRSPWFTTLLGALVICVLIWFFGPLLGFGEAHPLDTEIARFIVIAAVMVLWLVFNLVRELRARRHDKELVDGVAAAAPDPDATASAEEIALLGDRLRDAMHQLRRAKGGIGSGRHLYQLPWYMFIGPPGAGKTTALVNSGLKFPLAETGKSGAPSPIGGVGGTRNCDWWFTDQAVLIDTAGRYTTQDSHAALDSAAWLGFLRLLKKHRRRQPLNGVLVAISLSDLAQSSEAERSAHARSIRRRVRELHDELGVRIPVYVLLTKADLLAGFVEFFDNLGREDREQVWGMTFKLDDALATGDAAEAGAVAAFGAEFDALLERLNDRMLERVHQEPDIQRRRLIYGFPQQIASLRDVAADFLTETFRPSRLEARPLLRGVYFTSGTQDGTPIDRLLGAMAGQFGLQRQAVTAFSGTGRSYFLTRLIRDVVFGEAGLVSLDPAVERRARWIQRGVYAGCAALLLLMTAAWTGSYVGNRDLIAEVHAEVQRYNADYDTLAKRGPADTDLQAVLPPLDDVRGIRGGYDGRDKDVPLSLAFGLYQGNKLSTAAIDSYYRALDALLLPRLLARLESQMQGHLDKPDFLYQALKVYLILGRQGPADPELIGQWFDADFNASFPGDDAAPVRDALMGHLRAMLDRPPAAVPLNGPLVAQVRGILTQLPLAEYSYNRLLRAAAVRDLPPWTIADNAGPGADRVFVLRSGKPLNTPVPGIFTWAGYHQTFLPRLAEVSQDVTEDGWVLGQPNRGVAGTIAEVGKLRRDVLGLYLDDYVRRWDAVIADIAIKPFGNVSDGLDKLNLLSAPDSPLRDLLQAIDAQTQLSRKNATDATLAKEEDKGAKILQKTAGFGAYQARKGLSLEQNELADILGDTFGGPAGGGKPVDPATRVDAHFRAMHDFVAGSPDHPAGLEPAIQKIQALYQNLNAAANAPNPGQVQLAALAGGGGGGGAAGQLKDLAKGLPTPVAAMLDTVSQSSSALTASGASSALSDAWKSKVLPLCNEAFGRYPFVAGSSEDVPLDDFTRLLGPGGLIDAFFNDNLKPFVDTSSTPWHWQSADHTSLGLSPGTLTQFERAARIRDSLFSGGTAMQVRFQLLPVSLDPGMAKITIDIAGQAMTYDHGPAESTSFQWPGAGGKTLVRVTMTPVSGGSGTVIERDGSWALLRLLDAARVLPSGQPDKFRLVFSGPGGDATYELTASSVRNPFTMSALRSFRCPGRL